MDLFLLQKITIARLHQRCVPLDSGALLFLPRAGSGAVRLTRAEWDDLGAQFRRAIAPSARMLGWAMWLQIPLALVTLVVVTQVPALRAVSDAVDRFLPWLSVALMTTWPLIAGTAWHYREFARATRAVEQALAGRPRVPAPKLPARTGANVLEIAAMLLIGPQLFVHLYGTIFPHAFDNTPWTGTRLGMPDLLGFGVLAGLLILRSRRAPFTVADPAPDAAATARTFGRARRRS